MKFLDRLNISQRIIAGFAAIFAISIMITVVSYFTMLSFNAKFLEYENINDETNLVLDIEVQIMELQRQILVFRLNGSPAVISDITKLLGNIEALFDQIDDQNSTLGLDQDYTLLRSTFQRFREKVNQLGDEQLNINTVQEELIAQFDRTVELLDAVKSEDHFVNDELFRTLILTTHRNVSRAETHSTRYFLKRDFGTRSRAENNLKTAQALLKDYTKNSGAKNSNLEQQQLAELAGQVGNVIATFNRAITVDRNFIFYINVVLAGEASELILQSNILKDQFIERKSNLLAQSSNNLTLALYSVLITSSVLLLLTALLSIPIIRGIVSPILSITDTFRRLGLGQSVDAIPGIQRTDEIGELSRAADKFRHNQQQTEQLLEETQRVTRHLRSREQELEAINDELDNFAYVASHDLRSPLRAIDNLANWIHDDCFDVLPNDSKEHFRLLRSRINRMEQLLDDLLKYSRVGRVDSPAEPVVFTDVVNQSLDILEVPESVKIEIEDNVPEFMTRVTPLRQVLQNLIGNAIKYNDKSACVVQVSASRPSDELLQIEITDNGPGIAPEYHEKIFAMFTTLHSRDDVESSGMGLAIVKKVLESEGGSITIDSDVGQGCKFTFTWPIEVESDQVLCKEEL